MDPVYYAMDPQEEYVYQAWELYRCCLLRTLMSYNGSQGPSGAEPLPDLAAAPPEISSNGLVWTFRLRRGLHYAPPLQRTQITSPDIVRAILRSGDPDTGGIGPTGYLSVIQGYKAYHAGRSQSIAGLETPNAFTLRVTEAQPDGSLPYIFAMPNTAPIPPMPGSPDARFGVAQGHDFDQSNSDGASGYGHYLVASGPYMFAGSPSLDFATPGALQPVSGFRPEEHGPNGGVKRTGEILLVRNPSWSPSTDPLRPALADRIQIVIGDPDKLFTQFSDGQLDMIFSSPPPNALLDRTETDAPPHTRIYTSAGNGEVYAYFNVAQPPFDDVHVRWAVAQALDRAAILNVLRPELGAFGQIPYVVANHLAPDPTENSLLSGWNPFSNADGRADLKAARAALAQSRYAHGGSCAASSCNHVLVVVEPGLGDATPLVAHALAALGIGAEIRSPDGTYEECRDPRRHIALCLLNGWFGDFPSAANFFGYLFQRKSDGNISHLGASSEQLARWGYSTRSVPGVDTRLSQCSATIGSAQATCWASLDQLLMTQLVPAVPLCFYQPVRVIGPRITRFAWDQAYVEPALDRLAVAGS
jgi:peptide/nickel transport system substrate-binding protein